MVLDGGGPDATRLEEVAAVVTAQGSTVNHIRRRDLGEALSIFPLTTVVPKVAVEAAEARGSNPDSFGRDLPGRAVGWSRVQL